MDHTPGKTRWNNFNHSEEMRTPNIRTQVLNAIPLSTPERSLKPKTTVLSPDAPVFVPKSISNSNCTNLPHGGIHKNYNDLAGKLDNIHITSQYNNSTSHSINSQPSSVQTRLNPNNIQKRQANLRSLDNNYNKGGTSSMNSPFNEQKQRNGRDIIPEQGQSEEESFALHYVSEIVKCLSENPGLYDSIETRLKTVFQGFGNNRYVLTNAMETIFVQSIEEQNFRYMGARLYRVLDTINQQPNSLFRQLLDLKLNYHQSEVLTFMQNEQNKVRGTTLFLAELYTQLKNDSSQTNFIAENLVFTINQLLLKTTPENIKCICLALKLCGYQLEKDCPEEIFCIISKLGSIQTDVSTSRLLTTVMTLKQNNWGRNEPINKIQTMKDPKIPFGDEPVFYGPDGEIITEEENQFLESNIFEDENNCDEFSEDGMDPEMEMAYNEFLNDIKS